jgi:hypothetical protein
VRLYDVNGRLVNKNVAKYAVDWGGKCRSNIQFKVKKFLEPYWRPHIIFEEFPVFGSRLKVDLLNATTKIAVEVNGKQHESFNTFFHRGNPANYLKGIKNDHKKMLWLEKNGFQLLEIAEDEVSLISRRFFLEKFGITL